LIWHAHAAGVKRSSGKLHHAISKREQLKKWRCWVLRDNWRSLPPLPTMREYLLSLDARS
jgi:hypothetical protein